MVRSMHTDAFNHHPGQLLLFTGSMQFGRPTMGAWAVYGLGSESKNLPAFAVLARASGTSGGASNFSSGFLPSMYQGTLLRSSGDPILYLSNPAGCHARAAARRARCGSRSEPGTLDRDRRHGDRLPHRFVRTGVPHADGRSGTDGFLEGIAGHARDVRRQQRDHEAVRHELPAGAPHGGARRALS